MNTAKGADFAEFLIETRPLLCRHTGCTPRKSNAAWGKKAVKDALEWVFRHAPIKYWGYSIKDSLAMSMEEPHQLREI